jgi:transcriptional regulator of nitric oxide reductase
MTMENILVPVSPGEVLDKITILEIKSERMTDPEKLANVRTELALLRETWAKAVQQDDVVRRLHGALKEINEALWEIEDDIRDKERVKEFDDRFVELARSVYVTNDRRSQIKKELNLHLGSQIIEEKSYQDYT